MDGIDRGLDLIRARTIPCEAGADDVLAFFDEGAVPPGAIGVGQPDEAAVRGGASGTP